MLHVWLRAQHSPLAVWHENTEQWHAVDGWQQLHDIYSIHGYKTLCLYFPSSHLLQVDTELSIAQLKQLGSTGKQYLFEETSLTPVEQLAVRQIGYANNHYLYALVQSDIETWQQSAVLAGLTIQALLPDFLMLPVPEEGARQQVVLYQDEYTTLLRQSSYQGLAVSYLPLIFERLPQLNEVCVLPMLDISANSIVNSVIDSADNADNGINLQKTGSNPASNIAKETAALLAECQLLLTVLPATPTPMDNPERHALNFFTKSSDSHLSPYLRVAMMVALSALVLQIATDGVQWYRYSDAAIATQTEVASQYNSWFPDEALSTRTKLQAQVQPKLRNDSQAPASHIAVLARIAPLIKQSSLQAQALVMEPSVLRFTLIAPDRNSLNEFANTLSTQGLSANLEQINGNEQGQFSGQITVNVIADSSAPASATES
ncbi:type II secretion system protein GspL [Psychrobacter frigidicola]|uniref:type II secretion system protein GspL n=1 Tax=Psychrobacter frigidicola TaxID=45611 RepID=UPI001917EC6B|nr:type II secretion system protein GspL [Psychrobacter frigidicola]